MRDNKFSGFLIKHKRSTLFVFILISAVIAWLLIPLHTSEYLTSTVIDDSEGNLLGAKISQDGQWRFAYNPQVPEKFEKAIIEYEDRYFYRHPGINPGSLYRAFRQNLKAHKIVSGGSTLTMQTVRLARKKNRTYPQKFIEILLALRLELFRSKHEILALYTSNAPFGSNVVGLDAASWRYFGRASEKLSWAESATLAVLPNAPSLIHPGKNRDRLLIKRNNLLEKLLIRKIIDSITFRLSVTEPLIEKPLALPRDAPHLLDRIHETHAGMRVKTTINRVLQERINDILERHSQRLKANQIYNAAVLVIDNRSNTVLVYIGNTGNENPEYGSDVDIIRAPRSTGSILKPFLFAGVLDDGQLIPTSLVPDIPTQIAGYKPENYDITYDGAVPAKRALARSLNIPAVRILQNYTVPKLYVLLKNLGLTTLRFNSDHYGLSLILGGAEGSLWDIASVYSSFARTLNHYYSNDGNYYAGDFNKPDFYFSDEKKKMTPGEPLIGAASVWLTFESLVEVNRPDEESNWREFSSKDRIAWKTGTSFGFRDGWAVGVTPEFTVGVWVGNASGEGRPGLTGISTAAPVMFEILSLMPRSTWFHHPAEEMVKIPVCSRSGFRPGPNCEGTDSAWIPQQGLRTMACPYHKIVHLTKDERYRVSSQCEQTANMIHKKWFVLPPVMEWYYKSKNSFYKTLPPFRSGCEGEDDMPMEIIYPRELTKVYLPMGIEGKRQQVIFEVAHRKPESVIYWHLDGKYIDQTKRFHKLGFSPEKGEHILILVDEEGNTITRKFVVLDK